MAEADDRAGPTDAASGAHAPTPPTEPAAARRRRGAVARPGRSSARTAGMAVAAQSAPARRRALPAQARHRGRRGELASATPAKGATLLDQATDPARRGRGLDAEGPRRRRSRRRPSTTSPTQATEGADLLLAAYSRERRRRRRSPTCATSPRRAWTCSRPRPAGPTRAQRRAGSHAARRCCASTTQASRLPDLRQASPSRADQPDLGTGSHGALPADLPTSACPRSRLPTRPATRRPGSVHRRPARPPAPGGGPPTGQPTAATRPTPPTGCDATAGARRAAGPTGGHRRRAPAPCVPRPSTLTERDRRPDRRPARRRSTCRSVDVTALLGDVVDSVHRRPSTDPLDRRCRTRLTDGSAGALDPMRRRRSARRRTARCISSV